jgi:beta-lactam-binding protein with PASTA domain
MTFIKIIEQIAEFLKKHFIIRQIFYAVLILMIILIFSEVFLAIFTRHGQKIEVPDLTGLIYKDAAKLCRKKNMKLIISDSIFLANKKGGEIIEQNPKGGFFVKRNRKIYVVINSQQPEIVVVPNVFEISFRQAKATLQSTGIKVGKIEYTSDMALNTVKELKYRGKTIKANEKLPKYSVLDVVLGNGYGSNYANIPDLYGLKYEQTKDKILTSYFNIGKTFFDNSVKTLQDSLNSITYRQYPENGSSKIMGSYIDFWLTLDKSKLKNVYDENISVDTSEFTNQEIIE